MTRLATAPRLAIVLSHPTQYYSPWFRWIAANTDLEIRVFYLWDFGVAAHTDPQFKRTVVWDIDLLAGYQSEFVPNASSDPATNRFRGLDNPALTSRLTEWKPTALLLFGYQSASHLRVIVWAKRHHIPLIFRGDSHFLGRGRPGWLKRSILRLLYAQFSAFLYVGKANRAYFQDLGAPMRKLHFSPHSVDTSLFDSQQPAHRNAALALRRQLGLRDNTRVLLYAGKFVAAKQPMELLRAFAELAPANAVLLLVGDGPERNSLQAAAAAQAPGLVHFLPFTNQSEMPAVYLLADVFALPSRGHYETWGLAVNEAMHMGVPALVSDLVGCQQDLVEDGKTGWVWRHDGAETLTGTLCRAWADMNDASRRGAFLAGIKATISNHTYRQTTAGLLVAVDSVMAGN